MVRVDDILCFSQPLKEGSQGLQHEFWTIYLFTLDLAVTVLETLHKHMILKIDTSIGPCSPTNSTFNQTHVCVVFPLAS